MIMGYKKSTSVERTTVSIDSEVFKNAKSYSEKNNIKFSTLVSIALSRYVDDVIEFPSKQDENYFVEICEQLAGHTATARAKKAFQELSTRSSSNRVGQRAFLEHILRRAAIAAKFLSENPGAKYDGLRFFQDNKWSESYDPDTHKSSSSTPRDTSKVV